MIKIKKAYWKSKNGLLEEYEITTTVLEQDGLYFDPCNDDFLDALFKEFVRDFLKQDRVTFKLSKEDLFFYGENANVYMLNFIYSYLFPDSEQKPFNTILRDKEDGSINIGLFNLFDEQMLFLVEILEKMKISFFKLSKKYMLLSFPNSIECYNEDKIYNLRYEEWSKDDNK